MKKEFIYIQTQVTKHNISRVVIRQVDDIRKDMEGLVDAFHHDKMWDSLAYASRILHNWDINKDRVKIIKEQIGDCFWCQITGDEPIEGTLYLVLDGEEFITMFLDSDVTW